MNPSYRLLLAAPLIAVSLVLGIGDAAPGQYWQAVEQEDSAIRESGERRVAQFAGPRNSYAPPSGEANIFRFPPSSADNEQPLILAKQTRSAVRKTPKDEGDGDDGSDEDEAEDEADGDVEDEGEEDGGKEGDADEQGFIDWNFNSRWEAGLSEDPFSSGPHAVGSMSRDGPVHWSASSGPLKASPGVSHVPYHQGDFTPPPDYSHFHYDGFMESSPYFGKYLVPTERPWVELGRGLYLPGLVPPSQTWMGDTNLVAPHFMVYGDLRAAVAYNDNGAKDQWVNAYGLNLDIDWKITATERVHAFIGPLDRGGNLTRFVYDNSDVDFEEEFDDDFDNIFFEGDVGAMLGGFTGKYSAFDMPIATGIMPMLFQNGTWMLDNVLGAAVTLPARHSRKLFWSNYDLTFFTAFDRLNSAAFAGDDSQANAYGMHAFIEAYTGYLEVGYAYLDDQRGQGLGYHNIGVSFSRRYFQRISNSIRLVANVGQSPNAGPQTADGQLVTFESALITRNYSRVVPYLNLFAGFDRPQSVARAGGAGGILLNTGINFETDGLTGFPRLDDTANDTFGGAIGLNLLGPDFAWQLVTEFGVVQTHGNDSTRNIPDDQYAFGMRYQRPITNAWLIRADTIYGFRRQLDDLTGVRMELRYKF